MPDDHPQDIDITQDSGWSSVDCIIGVPGVILAEASEEKKPRISIKMRVKSCWDKQLGAWHEFGAEYSIAVCWATVWLTTEDRDTGVVSIDEKGIQRAIDAFGYKGSVVQFIEEAYGGTLALGPVRVTIGPDSKGVRRAQWLDPADSIPGSGRAKTMPSKLSGLLASYKKPAPPSDAPPPMLPPGSIPTAPAPASTDEIPF